MKKTIALLLSLVFIFALAACGSSESGASSIIDTKKDVEYTYSSDTVQEVSDYEMLADVTNEKRWKIGWSTTALDESNVISYEGMKQGAEELGVDLVVTSAENMVDKQISDIESLIEQKCDVIILKALDRDALSQVCGQARAAGIKVVITGMPVNTEEFDLLIVSDQAMCAKNQADYINKLLEDNPDLSLKIGYLWGNTGFSGIELRYRGFVDNLNYDTGRVEIISEQIANFNENEAIACTENWMQQYGDVMNCIVAQSDAMALGAVEAVRGAGKSLDDFYILGVDGTTGAIESIEKGELKMTVYTDLYKAGLYSIQQAVDLLNNPEKYAENKTFSSGNMFVALTQDNLDEVLNK